MGPLLKFLVTQLANKFPVFMEPEIRYHVYNSSPLQSVQTQSISQFYTLSVHFDTLLSFSFV